MEEALVVILKALCPRVFPDFAPLRTPKPYVTWQGIGGQTLRFTEGTAADKRNALIQVNVWAASRLQASNLARSIEDALCSTATLTARPVGEQTSTAEEDLGLYGTIQTFDIWATR